MLLTTSQAARLINVSVAQVNYALDRGKIVPAMTTPTRRRLFHPDQLPVLKERIQRRLSAQDLLLLS